MKSLSIILLLAAPLLSAEPRRIEVRPVEGRAVIAEALKEALPGDEIRLEPGIYREFVKPPSGVLISGSAGAIIDPSEAVPGEWKAADEVGPGVWKTPAPDEVRGLLIDGKFLAGLSEPRVRGEGLWHWKTLLTKGAPLSGFRKIRGLYLWKKDEKVLYVALGGENPGVHTWRWIRRGDAAITFHGVKGARVQGITLAGASAAVRFSGGSENCELRNCRIVSFEKNGVEVTEGSGGCAVVSNFITRGAWESWAPANEPGKARKEEYEIWQIHKNAGFYDRIGINLFRAGANNRILTNHIVETFDGINVGDYSVESLAKPLPNPEHGQGTEIGWNRIRDTRDSGIEIGGGAIDVRVHHNHLLRTHGGIRFKLPRVGPVFIHHNWLEDDRGFNIWFSMDSSPAEGYIYHNTISGHAAAIAYSSMEKDFDAGATPRWHVVNNLVVTDKGLFDDRTHGKLRPNFTSTHNVVAGGGRPWPEAENRETGSRYPESIALTDKLAFPADSPATGVARSLADYRNGKALPGWESGSEAGAGPLPDFPAAP
jgi:hypothetical protein